jgi:hypothetical protein
MVSKEDWGLKWNTKSKIRKWFYHLFEFKVPGEFLLLLKLNLDVTKELCVSNCKSWQTCYFLGWKKKNKIKISKA